MMEELLIKVIIFYFIISHHKHFQPVGESEGEMIINIQDVFVFQLKQKLKDDGVKGDVKVSWRKRPDGKILHKPKKKKDEL